MERAVWLTYADDVKRSVFILVLRPNKAGHYINSLTCRNHLIISLMLWHYPWLSDDNVLNKVRACLLSERPKTRHPIIRGC